jgi:hypothetical protein
LRDTQFDSVLKQALRNFAGSTIVKSLMVDWLADVLWEACVLEALSCSLIDPPP